MPKLRWLERSVQKTTASVGPVAQRLVRDFVVGNILAHSAILSAIARALRPDKRGFEAALERLSRGLQKQWRAVARVATAYRQRAVTAARRHGFDVWAIDSSDIIKPYGRKLPWLCEVRDASKSTRHKVVVGPGWSTIEVVATAWDHRVLPLLRHVYSTVHPTFESVQHELRAVLRLLRPLLWGAVRTVLDRGFDGENYFTVLDECLPDWAVRQRGDRQVYLPGHATPMRTSTVAKSLAQVHWARPQVVRRDELVYIRRSFGYCTIEVPKWSPKPGRKKPPCQLRGLISADRGDPTKLPVMLLVNRPLRTVEEARRWLEGYFRRWSAEDEIRSDKQLGGLEHVRVLNWQSLQSLVTLSTVVAGLLALTQVEAPQRAAGLARRAPVDGEVPAFALYRIWLSVALLLAGHTRRR